MKKLLSLLMVLVFILSFIPNINAVNAADSPLVSVKLKNYISNQKQLTISVKGEYTIANSTLSLVEGKQYTVKYENNKISLYENNNLLSTFTSLEAIPVVYGTANYMLINNRPYLGTMKFTNENNAYVRPINVLPLEDYLKGVVPFEMMASWNIEALKTQAVAARTYAARLTSIIIDDTINYQAYGGYTWNANSTKAVDDTRFQTLTYNGKLIDALYSASNGGKTESNANAWGGTALSIFPIKDDPYDTKVPWSFTLRKKQIDVSPLDLSHPENWWTSVKEADTTLTNNIKNWMYNNGYSNNEIKIISIPDLSFSNDKTSGGRVKSGSISVSFYLKDKSTGKYILDGNNQIKTNTTSFTNTSAIRIRAMIGISIIKSYLVTSYVDNGSAYVVSGLGNGHGVGMSQWGAKVMADKGFSYKDILNFYYPGTTLTNTEAVPASTTPVEAPTTTVPSASVPVTEPAPTPLVEDTIPPTISNVKSAYSASSHKITVDYTINEGTTTTVYVKNAKGTILSYPLKNKIQSAGHYQVSYDVAKSPNGNYTFGIKSTDINANTSSAIKTVTVSKSLSKLTPKVKTLSDRDTSLTGTTEAKAFITVKNGSKLIKTGTADTKGNFKIVIPKQKAGTKLSVYAKDIASNTSKAVYTTVKDKTAPGKPRVYTVTNRDYSISGTTEAKATIMVKKGSRLIISGKADSKGRFKLSIPKLKSGTKLTISSKDAAGNTSASTTLLVKVKR